MWGLLIAAAVATGAPDMARRAAALPDWSGVWQNFGPPDFTDLFDGATADPPGCRALNQPCRSHPPLTPVWEEKYRANLALSLAGRLPPESTTCMPRGTPANMRTADSMEFVLRPEQVWIFVENIQLPRRIFTDGRPHRTGKGAFPTYAGDSIGHWEGDTLVVETVNLRPGMMIDRSGLSLSGKAKLTERWRRLPDGTLEDRYLIEDAEALAKPWEVRRLYRRVPGGRMFDYACAENNRNPVDGEGVTHTLGPDGKPID